jgi:hypothetical protein
MPFKDSLSKIAKSIGDGAKSAAHKSGDMMEITKLNMSISSEENKIKGIYSKIGEVLYKKFADGQLVDDDLMELCTGIKAIEDNICSMRQKIEELKNHKPLDEKPEQNDDAVNHNILNDSDEEVKFYEESTDTFESSHSNAPGNTCQNCGEAVSDNLKFCPSCGTKLK